MVNPHKCVGYLYGAITKLQWLNKYASIRGSIWKASSPGECISVDHMESRTPGFISQLNGKPTKHCYRAVEIFLDHFSNLTYVHLQRGLLSDETAQAKKVFEDYTRTYRTRIKKYNTENRIFADNAFLQAVAQENQTISYCGVNSHFQKTRQRNA